MILLLELLQPASAVRFKVTFVIAYSRSEESRLFSNNRITERKTLSLMVSGPIC